MKKEKFKQALDIIKALLFEQDAPPIDTPPAAELVDIKGKDGNSYVCDKLEVGGIVSTKNEAGELTPVVAGEIEIEDGSILVIADGGTIAEIKAPVAAAAEQAPAAVSQEVFNALQTEFNDYKTAAEKVIADLNKSYDAKFSAMVDLVEASMNESEEDKPGEGKHSAFKAAKTEKQIAREKLKEAFNG